MASPSVIVLAEPNGAGKTTASMGLIQETLGLAEFVNADVVIAKGLSGLLLKARRCKRAESCWSGCTN